VSTRRYRVTLTAQDVHERQFRLVRQSTGYDIDEVDGFLDEVEAELRRLQSELDAARGGASPATAAGGPEAEASPAAAEGSAEAGAASEAEPGPDKPRTSVIEAPAAAAARILELAQRTADEYIAEAQKHADRIRADAAGLETRVTELRGYESELRSRLRGYFHTELEELKRVLGDD
jgi:DivIVA domain-containing protein